MSVLTQLLSRHHPRTRDKALLLEAAKEENKGYGENLWCALNFLMFIALGPFAAIPVLLSVFSLVPGDDMDEPETMGV